MQNNLKKYWQVFLIESLLFSLVAILGIISTLQIEKTLAVNNVRLEPISIGRFVLEFSVISLFIFLIIKYFKKEKQKDSLFKYLFIFIVFTGGILMLNVWLSDVISLLLMFFLVLLWIKKKNVFVHNLSVCLAISGTVGLAGLSISPPTMVILLILFSIYDFIAVYKTKHMVTMAQSMIRSGAIIGFIIPHKFSYFNRRVDNINKDWAFVLGGGDIAFPLMLISSLVPYGLSKAIIVSIFALIGLLLSFLIFIKQDDKKAIPALPPIALLSILGYLVSLFYV